MTVGSSSPWRMPGEFAAHDRCLMVWPTRLDLWNEHLDAARREYAETAAAIVAFEPVTMFATPSEADTARAMLSAEIDVVEMPADDSWLRDSGPIVTVDGSGGRSGVDFVFNSWGEKFSPWDQDALLAGRVLEHLGIERRASSMVLEGGSITVDGEGTLITTEQCVLHPSRNPDMSRTQIEAELATMLGVERVIWLPWGIVEDTHTDGHIDNVCAFVRPGVVIAHGSDDPTGPNHLRMNDNLEVLRASGLEVIEVPHTSFFEISTAGRTARYRNSYLNFYIANGGVVVPTADHANDADALAIISAAFPDHQVVGVHARTIAYGGGGIHCITQQLPSP